MDPRFERFEKPSLDNTASPTIITHDEYLRGKSGVKATYPGKAGDGLTFYLVADDVETHRIWQINLSDRPDYAKPITDVAEWEFVGKQICMFFEVIRDSKLLGRSKGFSFTILDK
ncbi:hypothetical protein NJC08_06125 [Pseudomonas fluorescens]|jgi:hypothetical protein|uniref:hypothetical protein n=1 Tax=Pseudomonas fluorescens TaxID=294 RepID=UPI00209ACB59|nr:hypothetical protein [Pseudomonas fluorescens]MCO7625981.1 hypothetical protein [Pseudomonas fluorescens]